MINAEDIRQPANGFSNYNVPVKGVPELSIPVIHPGLPKNTENVPFDIYDYEMLFRDEGTKKLMREGNTIGCFYIESPGMRSLLQRLDCDTFEMLTAASSVIRPGVAESGMMQEFVERHKNPERRKYLVAEMKIHLGETYGVMIYQEDVIKVAHHIAGLTLEEADLLRRAMSGKMRSREAMNRLAKRFTESCAGKNLSESITKELWRQIESFAGYAFCKAHSASFALLSFQVAYLKVHYPAEFMASVLSNRGGYYSPAVYVQECKRMGLRVLLPCINHSIYDYSADAKTVRIGFVEVKNLPGKTAERISAEREAGGVFKSLQDFLARTGAGYEESSVLIRCGAMDAFGKTRPTLMRLLDIYINHRRLIGNSNGSLFAEESLKLGDEIETDTDYTPEEKCAIEYETFGYMVTRHPLEFYGKITARKDIVKAADLKKYDGRRIKMLGWYMTSKRIKTKKGEIMKFLSLEDLTGTFEAVIFPKVYRKCAELTISMGPYLIEGIADIKNGNNITVEKLAVLTSQKALSVTEKDSAENKYYGEVEKFDEEEIGLVETLDREKLRRAYVE